MKQRAGWRTFFGFIGDARKTLDQYKIPYENEYTVGGGHDILMPDYVHELLVHWVYKLRTPGQVRSPLILNSDGIPMNFEDYVREVIKPACEANDPNPTQS